MKNFFFEGVGVFEQRTLVEFRKKIFFQFLSDYCSIFQLVLFVVEGALD